MDARLTTKGYSFEVETDEMLAVLHAEGFGAVPFLNERLDRIDGIVRCEYDGHFGPQFAVVFEVDGNGDPKGFDAARQGILEHIRLCESFGIYVGSHYDETYGKRLLHAGDGFVLCDSVAPGQEGLGVSLHFLYDGQRAAKWFTDGAARQFRELAGKGDAQAIGRIVAKHIDLGPSNSAPSLR